VLEQPAEDTLIAGFKAQQGKISPGAFATKIYPEGIKPVTTIEVHDGVAVWNEIISGRAVLYIYVRFIYRDDYLSSNKVWVTETCIFVASDQNIHFCDGHNDIYRQKVENVTSR
jgi:hypothetical protein